MHCMKHFFKSLFWVFAAVQCASAVPEGAVKIDAKHREFFELYCVECHNAEKTKGKVRLDEEAFPFQIDSLQSADQWQKILAALNAQDMPPEDELQPSAEEKAEFLSMLSGKMVEARELLTDSGGQIVMRRLNHREYQNTMEHLLGVPVDVSTLPVDDAGETFDTDGGALFLSPDQIEQYLAVAKAAVSDALEPAFEGDPVISRMEGETMAIDRIKKVHADLIDAGQRAAQYDSDPAESPDATKYGFTDPRAVMIARNRYQERDAVFQTFLDHPMTKTGYLLSYWFPQRELILRLQPYQRPKKVTDENIASHQLLMQKSGKFFPRGRYKMRARVGLTDEAIELGNHYFMEFGVRRNAGNFSRLDSFEVSASHQEGQIVETEIYVSDEDRTFAFSEETDKARHDHIYRENNDGTGAGHRIWLDWVEVEGPLKNRKSRALEKIVKTLVEGASREVVIEGLRYFGQSAYRGQEPKAVLLEKLYTIYEVNLQLGLKPLEAIVEPMAVMLSTPSFLYLSEPSGEMEEKLLSQRELAIRLSYLLTSSAPDAELLGYSEMGELRGDQLRKQVDRLLASPEADRFYEAFLYQWLDMERLAFFQFDVKKYPRFNDNIKDAAAQEIYQTVRTLVDENLGTEHLVKSDFVVVNALLADHYGLRGVHGDHFRKVQLPEDSVRGGLTGMAAILAMGSDGIHTSPVERGAWVLRKVLNDPPPPAPANVPMLSRLKEKKLTKIELLKLHQEEPQCAHCHKKMDPIGIGLENFDATGKWRTKKVLDKFRYKVEAAGKIHRGPEFANYLELRDYFSTKVDDFNLGLIEHLLGYSLGRKAGFADQELIESLHKEMKKDGNNLRSVIHGIVASEAFQTKK